MRLREFQFQGLVFLVIFFFSVVFFRFDLHLEAGVFFVTQFRFTLFASTGRFGVAGGGWWSIFFGWVHILVKKTIDLDRTAIFTYLP